MSQQDVTTLRSAYEAFNRGDIPAVLTAMDPQIAWHEPGGGHAPRGTFHGHQALVQNVFGMVPQHFDAFQAEPNQFIDAGDHIVVIGRFHGKAKNGQAFEVPFAHLWAMRNGKTASYHNYVEAAGWAAAWGG